MKKLTLFCLLGINLFSFADAANAEETLLDNHLELQTDRLNKEQVDDGKTRSFVAEDRLFEAEMIQKTTNAKALADKQKQEDMSQLFLTKGAKVKELDPTQLFTAAENNQAAVKKEATVPAVASHPALFPLILGLALVTVVTLFLYHNRKRGQNHGR